MAFRRGRATKNREIWRRQEGYMEGCFGCGTEEDGFGERRILGDRRAYGESIVFNSDLRAGQGVKVVMGQGSSGQW